MMRPEPLVSRVMPALLLLTALAGRAAAAAPDFEPMRGCNPELHKKFSLVKTVLDRPVPPNATAEEKEHKLKLLGNVFNEVTLGTDDLVWPVKAAGPLPETCRLDADAIKDGIYGGLADLRGKLGARGQEALPEDQKALGESLTKREVEADQLMGDRTKKLSALAGSLSEAQSGIGQIASQGDLPEGVKERTEFLKVRLSGIHQRVELAQAAGSDTPGVTEPEAVREASRKRAEDARQRAGGAMNGNFGSERKDDTANGAPAGGGAATRTDSANGAAAPGGQGKAARRGPDLIDSAGINGGGGEPTKTGPAPQPPGPVARAIKDSTMKPLGGVIDPPSEAEATQRLARKDEARKSALRVQNSGDTFAEMDAIQERGHNVESLKLTAGGSGEVVLERTKGGRERMRFGIKDWKLDTKADTVLTPEEQGTIEAALEVEGKKIRAR